MDMRKALADSLTKQKLLDAAQELMLSRGYTATSVDQVCKVAGLTKGSFFHYFEGKEHLGRLVVQRYYACWQQMSRSAPFRLKKDPLDRVFGSVDFFIQMSHAPTWKVCLLGILVQELSQTHPQIRSTCAACLDDLADSLKKDLEEAKNKYAPRARWTARGLAEHLIVVAQGAAILAKARQDRKIFENNLRHFKEYLRHLFNR
jgi:TetR/AcrR family transcriptional repressor of nem operon